MKRIVITSLTFAFATFALGHSPLAQTAEIKAVSVTLAPMPKPAPQIGSTRTWKHSNGKKYTETIVGADETTAKYQTSSGCTSTRPHHEFLSQYFEWKNCGSRRSNGRGTITNLEGKIWPLMVGNKLKYDYEGSLDSGRSWSDRNKCEVKGQVRVNVPAGSFDTYHIVCESEYIRREYHISPDIKMNVLYKWEHKYKLRDRFRELVSYEPGKAN
ncbi:MAG: hypothetical protein F4X91_14495 [Nitrospinae bacterium]|nr:hypothetical protein [Nitrospinota bacterium]